ncbi:MAG: hypothetical protein QXO84_02920 [Candidatus Aenigmatarchaeota archaeon]
MRIAVLALILMLFFSTCSAKDYDSIVEIATKEVTVKQCGIATFDLKIKNTGEKEDTFYVVVEGLPEGTYATSHETINLKPNESRNIYLFVTASCLEPKNHTGKISFLGNSKSEVDFKMNTIVEHGIDILLPKNVTICICEEKNITILIKNTGLYDEDVKLIAVGGKLKNERVKLEPGETKEIEVLLEKSCNISPEKYNLEIIGESLSSYAKVRKVFVIGRENCYDFQISYPKEVRTCVNEETKFNISVSNVGSMDDEYELRIDALNVFQTMKVKRGETKFYIINFTSFDAGIMDVSFSIKGMAETEKGNIRFLIDRCYGVDLQLEVNRADIELGSGKMIKGKIINTGSRDDRYDISSDVEWVSIKPSNVSLKSLESEDVFIYYSPIYGMKGTFQTQIKAQSLKAVDVENVTINVYEFLPPIMPEENESIEIIQENVSETPKEISGQTTKTTIENILKNKSLVAIIIGIILTLVVFGLVYLFVMRE